MDSLPVWLSTFIIGLGTVFIALFALIYIIKLMGYACGKLIKKKPEMITDDKKELTKPVQNQDAIENRGEVIAAASAAIATIMGKDVNAIRIVSVKKVD